MNLELLLHVLCYLEVALCAVALCVIIYRKQWGDYAALGWFLAVRVISNSALIYMHKAAAAHAISKRAAYHLYFGVYWPSFAVESVLALLVVYSIFKLAMAPLKGLQALGMLIFKWAAGISVAVALGSAFAPGLKGTDLLVSAISQVQRTQSILTLCLLMFVCFAIRPMGLSYSSRIFGVSLGLGVMATNDLVQSAWLTFHPHMDTTYSVINGFVICLILATWTGYFALPEPKRRIIVLPTTSPFLRWNQISQALGDNPGFVAIGGVPPELFAPAEIEVMRRASLKMTAPVTQFPVSSLSQERLSASRAI
ncbi:MAG: hypothetical protein M3O31_02720 [Acidobacteriota bacterium]|nr:hypothetical protein [Acidobacteriota bacterium]